jgi:hypothetical protein
MNVLQISPATISLLPAVDIVKRSWQAVAMLEALLNPEEDWRVFRYISEWRDGYSLAHIDTRSEGDSHGVFLGECAIIRGYDEGSAILARSRDPVEAEIASPTSRIPAQLRDFLTDPALYEHAAATFCIWQEAHDSQWQMLDCMKRPQIVDEPLAFVNMLCGDPRPTVKWVEEYYELLRLADLVDALYAFTPLSEEIIARKQPDVERGAVLEAARTIGYPVDL